jgi:hypothetical protein
VITSRLGARIEELKRGRYRARSCVSRRQAAALYHVWIEMLDLVLALRAGDQVQAARRYARAMRDLMIAFSDRGEQRWRASQPIVRAYRERVG